VEGVPWSVSLFVSWLPFFVWINVIWWIGRVVGRRIEGALRTPDGRSLGDVIAVHARETRRTNELLAQVAKERGAAAR